VVVLFKVLDNDARSCYNRTYDKSNQKASLAQTYSGTQSNTFRKFDMSVWVRTNEQGCQTVGCAVGWYCMKNPRAQLKVIDGMIESGTYNEREIGFTAVGNHFGIDRSCTVYLFSESRYWSSSTPLLELRAVTKQDVLERVEEFANQYIFI
jgi:hypothetical protein